MLNPANRWQRPVTVKRVQVGRANTSGLGISDLLHNPADEYRQAFDGIFSEVTRHCGGKNPHIAGEIIVSSNATRYNDPWSVLDRRPENYWYTDSVEEPFILFDMHKYEVNIRGYSIQTNFTPGEGWHLRSWAILGSNDNINWTCLDEVRGSNMLNGRHKWVKLDVVPMGWMRYLMLKMTDINHRGDWTLTIANFEIFGEIRNQKDNVL